MKPGFLLLLSIVFVVLFAGFAQGQLDGNEVNFGQPYWQDGISIISPISPEQRIEGFVNVTFINISAKSTLEIKLMEADSWDWGMAIFEIIETKEYSLTDVLDEQDLDYNLSSNHKNISAGFTLIDLLPLNFVTIAYDDLDFPDEYAGGDDYKVFALKISILDEDDDPYKYYGEWSESVALAGFLIDPVPIVKVEPLYGAPDVKIKFNASKSFHPNSTVDLDEYFWYFGDGDTKKTTKNWVEHEYDESGNYTLFLNITDEDGLIGRNAFDIIISPSYGLEEKLEAKREELTDLKTSLLAGFERNMVLLAINANKITSAIDSIEAEYDDLMDEGDWIENDIIKLQENLTSIEIPRKVYDTSIVSAELVPDLARINPAHVKSLSTEFTTVTSGMANEIALWQQKNVAVTLDGEVKSGLYESGSKEIVSIVKIALSPAFGVSKYYLVLTLPSPGNLIGVDGTVTYKELAKGVIGFTLTNEQEIVLATDSTNLVNIRAFASPALSGLEVGITRPITCGNKICESGETAKNCPEDCREPLTGLTLLIIVLIVLIGAVVAFFIWYKRTGKLPSKLFKTKRDYENILSFIKKNLDKKSPLEIKSILLRAGWKVEQVDYAMKRALRGRKGAAQKPRATQQRPALIRRRPVRRRSSRRPARPMIGMAPSGARPSGARPSGARPSGARPSGARPSGARPSGARPSGARYPQRRRY